MFICKCRFKCIYVYVNKYMCIYKYLCITCMYVCMYVYIYLYLKPPCSLAQLKLMSWEKKTTTQKSRVQGHEVTDNIEWPHQIPPHSLKGLCGHGGNWGTLRIPAGKIG